MNNFGLKLCLSVSLVCLTALTNGEPAGAQISVSAANSVTIINTGYGVLPGYRITVSASGQITSTMQPRRRAKPIVRTDQMTAFNRQRFFHDLTKAEPLAALPVGTAQRTNGGRQRRGNRNTPPAMRVSVPGPQVYIVYQGQQSPNLRAASSSVGQALYQDVTKIMQDVRMPIPNPS